MPAVPKVHVPPLRPLPPPPPPPASPLASNDLIARLPLDPKNHPYPSRPEFLKTQAVSNMQTTHALAENSTTPSIPAPDAGTGGFSFAEPSQNQVPALAAPFQLSGTASHHHNHHHHYQAPFPRFLILCPVVLVLVLSALYAYNLHRRGRFSEIWNEMGEAFKIPPSHARRMGYKTRFTYMREPRRWKGAARRLEARGFAIGLDGVDERFSGAGEGRVKGLERWSGRTRGGKGGSRDEEMAVEMREMDRAKIAHDRGREFVG